MTTVAVNGLVYDQKPAQASSFFQRLRAAYAEARRHAEQSNALSTAAALGPEQMKEMGYYNDPQTGLVYSHVLGR